jgi:hypothetical protein
MQPQTELGKLTSYGRLGIWAGATIFVLLMCAAGLSQAQAAQSSDNAAAGKEELDQVIVRGGPKALAALRDEMVRVEDSFYELYNELNSVDDYDVYCAMETSAGTALKRRACRANYQRDALAAEGAAHMEFIKKHPRLKVAQSGGNDRPAEEPTLIDSLPPPAIMDIEIRRKEYQQNVIRLSRESPELVKLLRELSDLNERYRAIQSSRGEARAGKAK